jgi:hypothetical protein
MSGLTDVLCTTHTADGVMKLKELTQRVGCYRVLVCWLRLPATITCHQSRASSHAEPCLAKRSLAKRTWSLYLHCVSRLECGRCVCCAGRTWAGGYFSAVPPAQTRKTGCGAIGASRKPPPRARLRECAGGCYHSPHRGLQRRRNVTGPSALGAGSAPW